MLNSKRSFHFDYQLYHLYDLLFISGSELDWKSQLEFLPLGIIAIIDEFQGRTSQVNKHRRLQIPRKHTIKYK